MTHWKLTGGVGVEILSLIDDHSRVCVGSDARGVFKAADVVASFTEAAAAYGVPAGMLSDNGAVFTGKSRGGGRVALEHELGRLGVAFRHSRPYHPQTCGKVERRRRAELGRELLDPAAERQYGRSLILSAMGAAPVGPVIGRRRPECGD